MNKSIGKLQTKIIDKWLSDDKLIINLRVNIIEKDTNDILNDITIRCPVSDEENTKLKIKNRIKDIMKETLREEKRKRELPERDLSFLDNIQSDIYEYDPEEEK